MRNFATFDSVYNLLSAEVTDEQLEWNVLDVCLVCCIVAFGPDSLGVGLCQVREEVTDVFSGSFGGSSVLLVFLSLVTLQVEASELRQCLTRLTSCLVRFCSALLLGCVLAFVNFCNLGLCVHTYTSCYILRCFELSRQCLSRGCCLHWLTRHIETTSVQARVLSCITVTSPSRVVLSKKHLPFPLCFFSYLLSLLLNLRIFFLHV